MLFNGCEVVARCANIINWPLEIFNLTNVSHNLLEAVISLNVIDWGLEGFQFDNILHDFTEVMLRLWHVDGPLQGLQLLSHCVDLVVVMLVQNFVDWTQQALDVVWLGHLRNVVVLGHVKVVLGSVEFTQGKSIGDDLKIKEEGTKMHKIKICAEPP